MNTLIIEDEPLVAKDLRKLILKIDPTINIVTVLDSLKACIAYFKANQEPDLLFMDIQLSDGISFDLFKEVEISCPIIFTTAYDEYAIRAFKLNSIDYLLKPVDKIELASAIEKFKNRLNSGNYDFNAQFQQLLKQMNLPKEIKFYKERFMAHAGRSYVVIDYSNIAYFLKDTLIYIVAKDKQRFVTDFQTMEEVEELLDPKYFYRANRQMIVQADFVESFRADIYGKLIAKLKSPINITVDISREKALAFKTWING